MGVGYGIVRKSGSWYAYGEERLGQGKENARDTLKENKVLAEQIRREIYIKAGLLDASAVDVQSPVVQPEA